MGKLHIAHEMPFMVCLSFGALISATDPVTVLAVFQVGVKFTVKMVDDDQLRGGT